MQNIKIFTSKGALTEEAAALILTSATVAIKERGRFTIALSGGSTPQALFARLGEAPYDQQMPWLNSHFFWGDERLVPPDEDGCNYFHASNLLFDQVPVPPANIHRARGELEAKAAVEDYTNQLRAFAGEQRPWPIFDLVLLGLGSDGHTASLFPGTPAQEKPQTAVKAVTAAYEGRPAQRLTLTPAVFNDARHVLFLVTGANKAEAVSAVLEGPFDPEQWPAQRIQPAQGVVTWFLDQPAASRLKKPQQS